MKVRLYTDIYTRGPKSSPEDSFISARNKPNALSEGWTRFYFDVDFPPEVFAEAHPLPPTEAKFLGGAKGVGEYQYSIAVKASDVSR